MKISKRAICLSAVAGFALAFALGCSGGKPAGPDDPPASDTTLTLLNTVDFSAYNTSPGPILVESPFAYVAGANGSLFTVDISDTLNPHIVDSYLSYGDSLWIESFYANAFTKSGNLVCLVAQSGDDQITPSRARIFSVSAQGHITLQGTIQASYYDIGHRYNDMHGNVTLDGNILYIDWHVYDVSNPASPQALGTLGSYYSLGLLWGAESPVVIFGNYALFSGKYTDTAFHQCLWICDRSTREATKVFTLPDDVGHTQLAVVSTTAYAYGQNIHSTLSPITQISLASVTDPQIVRTDRHPGGQFWFGATQLARGNYIEDHMQLKGLEICDLNLNRVKANDTLQVNGCAITSDRIYVSGSDKLLIFRTP